MSKDFKKTEIVDIDINKRMIFLGCTTLLFAMF